MNQPQQTFSNADLLSAGATCYIYTLHASNDPECRPRYVGFTIRPKRRQIEHNSGFGVGRNGEWIRGLLAAGHKVVLTVIFKFRSDNITERGVVEATWIEKYRCQFSDLLNDAGGGSGVATVSMHCRKRNSESKKKYFRENPDATKRHSDVMRRRYLTDPEARKKISRASIAFWDDPLKRKRKSEHSKKYWSDPQAREKQSERVRNRYLTKEQKDKHSAILKARFADPIIRKKFSDSHKQRFTDPKERNKISVASKRFWANPENKKRMSEAAKLRWAKRREQK